MKQIIFGTIIIACISILNAAVSAITPTKVQTGTEKITLTLTALEGDTDDNSVIQFHTSKPNMNTTPPPADCTGKGTITITCTQAFPTAGTYNVYIDTGKSGSVDVLAKAPLISGLEPKIATKGVSGTFVLSTTPSTITAATQIQFATTASVTTSAPAPITCNGLDSASVSCPYTFTTTGTYNVFIAEYPQGSAHQIVVSESPAVDVILTALDPKTANRDTSTTFTLTTKANSDTTDQTKIQFSTASTVTAASPTHESCTGFGSTTIKCTKTFTESGTYNVFINQQPQGSAYQITVSSGFIRSALMILIGLLIL